MRTNAMKKRIYKKYLTMNPQFASMLYLDGKISYAKYKMAVYSELLKYGTDKNLEEKLIEIIYG